MSLIFSRLRSLKRKTEDALYNIKGKIKLECNGVRAVFDSTYSSQWRLLKWRYKSEFDILQDLIDELRSDDVYLDVGASLGLHTCLPAKKIVAEKVIAVEPYPPSLDQLRKNVSLNGLDNTTILGVAMSDNGGSMAFDVKSTSVALDGGGIAVDSKKGDSLISQGKMPQPTVAKIDVEGSEPLVIEGLRKALRKEQFRLLYCEVHLPADHRPSIEDFGVGLSEFKAELESCGFNITVMRRRNEEVFLKGKKCSR